MGPVKGIVGQSVGIGVDGVGLLLLLLWWWWWWWLLLLLIDWIDHLMTLVVTMKAVMGLGRLNRLGVNWPCCCCCCCLVMTCGCVSC